MIGQYRLPSTAVASRGIVFILLFYAPWFSDEAIEIDLYTIGDKDSLSRSYLEGSMHTGCRFNI